MSRIAIERMSRDDVPAVMAIDGFSFPTPWSETAYRNELGNVNAHYYVARLTDGGEKMGPDTGRVVGYAGGWVIMDEAHITTLAVHPDYRRRGIAERLLAVLLQEAVARGVRRATLEVRETNLGAQALYHRFGFEPIARRRGYYADTGEDAIVMWVEDLDQGVQVFRCSGLQDESIRTPEHLNT